MTLPITSLYAALLTMMMLGLAASVIAKRAATGISILHGDNMDLALATRRFGNFIEYVPMALLLMALMELQSASGLATLQPLEPDFVTYQPFHPLKADLLRCMADPTGAEAYNAALALTRNEPEKRFLEWKKGTPIYPD